MKQPKWAAVPKFFVNETKRCEWRREKENIPPGYKQYWHIYYNGWHVGEIFEGKSLWFAVLFGKFTLRSKDVEGLCLHISGIYAHPKN